jgi:hypothetical protein
MAEPALARVRLVAATLPGHSGAALLDVCSIETYAERVAELAAEVGVDAIDTIEDETTGTDANYPSHRGSQGLESPQLHIWPSFYRAATTHRQGRRWFDPHLTPKRSGPAPC